MCKKLSIIIPVYNEEKTLQDVLQTYQQLNPFEIIVVANGCNDKSVEIAKDNHCRVLIYDEPLGHNVGRAIGAKEAKGDILLFVDADFTIDPATLEQFLKPLMERKTDVVLNNLNYIFYKRQIPHSTTIWRQVTNRFFHRSDLGIDSLVSVPNAMTKEVIDKIGADSLANPTLAHLRIIQQKFRIFNNMQIDVISVNRFSTQQHLNTAKTLSVSEKRIIGNHIEAMAAWFKDVQHPRANYSDGDRKRDIVEGLKLKKQEYMPKIIGGWGKRSQNYGGKQVSIIIPVQNEENVIGAIIKEVRKIDPFEIIIVVNGTTDKTAEVAKSYGATIIVYEEELGNDTGRAVGAYFAKGDILLFIDGDFVIPATDLLPFIYEVQHGVDLALNNLEHYLAYRFPFHIVTACKYAINLACDRKDLGIGSTTAIPHAFSKKCIDEIGFETLVSPVYSQMKTILDGYNVKNVHRVEVDQMNKIRPDKHFAKNKGELPPSTTRIVGDHIEGISYLIKRMGKRGLF
ncbi:MULTISPECIES: glycosyltransferase [unclassified Bacillus (in: firmicutes)]|uniref:glycosyltransferase family 2 protein n=1 Tax=unclassified Bacillus (in: firmicutes) TaxID=185979 RepID=UPI0008EF9FAF|nr:MULTISPECIES: glycosyltransferase [unclassified Bacillus (in: firmicutes)]SFI28100.1 hypothetical protein SAMN04488574_102211 [Bacillus sp. 71mf]SFS39621.1 hypothetical protein SAMN04488145_101255 [Bacillus sp. 103mf]